MIIMLTVNGIKSQNQRLDEMVSVCNGQDLLHVIARACAIFKRSSTMSQDLPRKHMSFIITKTLYFFTNTIYACFKKTINSIRGPEKLSLNI